jgi:Fe-S-cluster-containing dehydrogenase component
MARYGMVIDLQKCAACGACALACKSENNTPDRTNGQTFNWADYLNEYSGAFPDVKYSSTPVLCNHCSNAPCVEVCPVTPKAMFKTDDGITMHNDERCIGCRLCQGACPYSAQDVEKEGVQYSVISYNDNVEEPHGLYRDTTELIPNGTASGAEIAEKAGSLPPHATVYTHPDYEPVRRKGIVEKCILCAHRLANNEEPACVETCPSGARVVGDLDDPNSEAAKLLKQHKAMRLKEDAGTEPNVYYIRSFKAV